MTLPQVEGRPPLLAPLAGIVRVFVDGAHMQGCRLLGPTDALPAAAAPRLGLAAAAGAPGWSAAYMTAVVDPAGGWAALGPWLVVPPGPIRLDRLAASGRPLRFPAGPGDPMATAPTAAPGDVAIVLSDREGAEIDGFGGQRHPAP